MALGYVLEFQNGYQGSDISGVGGGGSGSGEDLFSNLKITAVLYSSM